MSHKKVKRWNQNINKNIKINKIPDSSDDDDENDTDDEIVSNFDKVDNEEKEDIDCDTIQDKNNKENDLIIKKLFKTIKWEETNSIIHYPQFDFMGVDKPLTNNDADHLLSPPDIFRYFFLMI